MSTPPLSKGMARIRVVMLSNHIENLERQIVDLKSKTTGAYGHPLDAQGIAEVKQEVAAIRKKIAGLRNAIRKRR